MAQISGEYDINLDANKLQTSAGDLSTYNQKLYNNVESIIYISNEISNGWTNDTTGFSDVLQGLNKINDCIDKINNVVFPVLDQYVETMINLSTATSKTAEETMESQS